MRLKIWGKRLRKIIGIGLIILFVGLSFPQIYGMKCYSVMSGSMSPDLPVGSAIYIKEKNPAEIEKGEIITFTTEQGRTMITHRVAENNKEKKFFITKGDSNQCQDTKPVKWENLQGAVVFCIPLAGYVQNFLGSKIGKAAAIFLILAVYLVTEIFEGADQKESEIS